MIYRTNRIRNKTVREVGMAESVNVMVVIKTKLKWFDT